eukprot:INCI2247.1.p1 GENE.INCI2247.1~~INCI2247.1.p1  ORF type:complete len:448 (+),score=117.29 INCI2247.1:464-1807(+)
MADSKAGKKSKRKSKRRDSEDAGQAVTARNASATSDAAPKTSPPPTKKIRPDSSDLPAAQSAARIAAAAAAATDARERKRLKAIAKKKRLKANRQARKRAAAASETSVDNKKDAANASELKTAADNIAKKMLKQQRKQQKKLAAAAAASIAEGAAAAAAATETDQSKQLSGPNALFYQKLAEKKGPKVSKKWDRHIVFVGQLPFSATEEQIREHFAKQGVEIDRVRMLTDKRTGKFRGTCFLDLPNNRMQSVALRLHHSEFGDGAARRCINVERTCGGGGKSSTRLTKLEEMRAVQGEKVLSETKAIIAKVVDESGNATAKACQLDDKVVQSLCTFPRTIAQQIVEDFVATVDEKVKNPNAWLMGTLKRYRAGIANGEDLASLKISDENNTEHYRPGRKHQRPGGKDVEEYTYDGTGTQDSGSGSASQPPQAASAAKRYGYIAYSED